MSTKTFELWLDAWVMASLLRTEDPNAQAWESVQRVRTMRAFAAAYGAQALEVCDDESRPLVDALPVESLASFWPVAA